MHLHIAAWVLPAGLGFLGGVIVGGLAAAWSMAGVLGNAMGALTNL